MPPLPRISIHAHIDSMPTRIWTPWRHTACAAGTTQTGHSDDMDPEGDAVDVVRRGYDALSLRYRADDAPAGQYGPWIEELLRRLPPAARVLDVGCGCGVPVARDLAAAGHRVTGVDLSGVQIERARNIVPRAKFVHGDVTTLTWPAASFDAVVALYSIIHIPLSRQPSLLAAFARWLVDNGVLLLTAGAHAWTGSERGWLGGDADMWWSHSDAETYRGWLTATGFRVDGEHFVPAGNSGHSLFWATRHADPQYNQK